VIIAAILPLLTCHSIMATVARCIGAGLASAALAQQVGHYGQEWHIPMAIESCSHGGNCQREENAVVMDMQWRWLHNKDGYNNCLSDGSWDNSLCPDGQTCSRNCAVEGVDYNGYTQNYKAWPINNGIKLEFPNAPRVYMLENQDTYKLFKLKNREFTFDVDLSTLPCGMNAALYFIEMSADGDRNDLNQAGAKYGTGYCDAQCPHMRFIKGEANLEGWDEAQCAENPDGETKCGGHSGRKGYCCAEMDILEANREAGVYTAHPCTRAGPAVCEGKDQCGDRGEGVTGFCDKDGCGFSSYRMGDEHFWGKGDGYTVDTSKPMTIVTQFVTSDGTDSGDLVDIRRIYIQGGKVVKNSNANVLPGGGDSLTDAMCLEQNSVFQEPHYTFGDAGKLKVMGEALERGMVLSMSVWDDPWARMLWLDGEKSRFDQDMSKPGVRRGPCPFNYGTHEDMLAGGTKSVSFTNVKYGPIDSTFSVV
jgi:cellulose 1,4-beta-cellobiosidase